MCLLPRRIQKQLTCGSSLRGSIQQVLLKPSQQHLNPQPPTRYYSAGAQHHQVVQHSNTASAAPGALNQTLREPAGCVLLGCCRSQPTTPGWNASSPKGHEGTKELACHSSRSSWRQDRENTGCANLWGGSREIHHSSWVRLLSGEDAHWDCKSPGFTCLYLNYFFSSGTLFQGEDILTLSYKSYSIVQHPEFKVSGQEEKLHITL